MATPEPSSPAVISIGSSPEVALMAPNAITEAGNSFESARTTPSPEGPKEDAALIKTEQALVSASDALAAVAPTAPSAVSETLVLPAQESNDTTAACEETPATTNDNDCDDSCAPVKNKPATKAPKGKKRAQPDSTTDACEPAKTKAKSDPKQKASTTKGNEGKVQKGSSAKGKLPVAKKALPKKTVPKKSLPDKSLLQNNAQDIPPPKPIKKPASKTTASTVDSNRRTTAFKSRRGPSFQGAGVDDTKASKDKPMEFSTTCYYVQLGDQGQTFFIHEYHLSKSSRLKAACDAAKAKSRKTQQQIIQLPPHDEGAFGQLVGFFYSDTLKLLDINKGRERVGERMTEFAKLMSLANIYAMPGLQKEILRVVTREKIVNKAGAAAFFQWGEDMWYEDLDEEKGPFVTYFRRYAPGIFQIATEQDVKQMLRSVEVGGTYIKECFIALHKALGTAQTPEFKLEDAMMDLA